MCFYFEENGSILVRTKALFVIKKKKLHLFFQKALIFLLYIVPPLLKEGYIYTSKFVLSLKIYWVDVDTGQPIILLKSIENNKSMSI